MSDDQDGCEWVSVSRQHTSDSSLLPLALASGSKLESDVCCRLQVAPSGESYGSVTVGLAESNGSLLPGIGPMA